MRHGGIHERHYENSTEKVYFLEQIVLWGVYPIANSQHFELMFWYRWRLGLVEQTHSDDSSLATPKMLLSPSERRGGRRKCLLPPKPFLKPWRSSVLVRMDIGQFPAHCSHQLFLIMAAWQLPQLNPATIGGIQGPFLVSIQSPATLKPAATAPAAPLDQFGRLPSGLNSSPARSRHF